MNNYRTENIFPSTSNKYVITGFTSPKILKYFSLFSLEHNAAMLSIFNDCSSSVILRTSISSRGIFPNESKIQSNGSYNKVKYRLLINSNTSNCTVRMSELTNLSFKKTQ